jgi:hypothetical protein
MNCFEFLGLSKDHRALGKVVQLVKNYDEVTPKRVVYPLLGQIKYDGVFAMIVVKPDRTAIFGRTGKQLSLLEGICAKYSFLKPGVYIGELCLPGKSLEVLSGIVNPNRTNSLDPTLMNYWIQNREMYFHDFLTTEEFIIGQSDNTYSSRRRDLISAGLPCIHTIDLHSVTDAELFAKACIDSGHEGIVIKSDTDWVAGHKGWRSLKKVKQISYDLLCVGTEEGTGKYAGKVANLLFRWRDGDVIKAMLGKNYTHMDAEVMFSDPGYSPEGQVYRVYGLQDSSKGKIRLPKVGELRIDKATPDF